MSVYDLEWVARMERRRRVRQTQTKPIREREAGGCVDRKPSPYDLSRPGMGLSVPKRGGR